ncbi:hypothetical protein [uncultured Sphingomonas sp.]|uniref:hypothetical protein n=1 Tax=uncultured Sphingomonas sp. TaxID=158754 RepID=UPI00345026F6
MLRNLPGIRVEASGGEGNANISVRGLPVASGGAKFLQLQEDSLPVLEFGDIIFGIFGHRHLHPQRPVARADRVGAWRLGVDLRQQLARWHHQLHLEDG